MRRFLSQISINSDKCLRSVDLYLNYYRWLDLLLPSRSVIDESTSGSILVTEINLAAMSLTGKAGCTENPPRGAAACRATAYN